jgi:hypothetical protein
MSTSLDYASAATSPLRPGYLAIGSALLALVFILQNVAAILAGYFLAPARPFLLALSATSILRGLLVLTAIPLLAAAVPPASAAQNARWRILSCLALAATLLLINVIVFLCYLLIPAPNNPAPALLQILSLMNTLLALTLYLGAAAYLISVGKRLGLPALGIIAACGTCLPALMSLVRLLMDTLTMLHLAPASLTTVSSMRTLSLASNLAGVCFSLTWLSVALFAAILALASRRR